MNQKLSLITILIFFAISSTCFAELNEKDKIKELLKKLDTGIRKELITKARVFNPKKSNLHEHSPDQLLAENVLEEQSKICGKHLTYSDDPAKPNINWPTIKCKYHRPEDSLGGSTPKFLCDIQEASKEGSVASKTRKIKHHELFQTVQKSELIPSVLASILSRRLGFFTENYCPVAKVTCEGCPSSAPWKFGKSQGKASNENFDFEDVIIEYKADLMVVEPNIPRAQKSKSPGLDLNHLKLNDLSDMAEAKERAIEREAWLLWLNFVVEMDGTPSNQRISCGKAKLIDSSQVECEKPYIYTHDYGQSFYRKFRFDKWRTVPSLIQEKDGLCRGGMTAQVMKETGGSESSAEVGPIISDEARNLLVKRLSNISDAQIIQIARFANIQRIFKISPEEFLKVLKQKIATLQSVNCRPFDEGLSVLALKR